MGVSLNRAVGRISLAIFPLAVACWLALGASQASASHVSCGDTINADTTLDSDLVDCPNNGIVIGADGVTLDLNGHLIDGDGTPDAGCDPETEFCDVGVVNDGHAGVTIERGAIQEFAFGVIVLDAHHNRLRELSVSENLFEGVVIAASARTEMERSTVSANGLTTDRAGVAVFDSHDGLFSRNRVSGNGDIGFFIEGFDDNRIERNTVSGNPEAAMLIEGNRNEIDRNRVFRNGEGISIGGDGNAITRNHVSDSRAGLEGGGLGIFVEAGTGNVIERNVIAGASRIGILVSLLPEELEGGPPAVGTVVRRNHLRDGKGDGVFVQTTALDTLLLGNHAVGSEDDGIDVNSAATTLIGNHAFHNGDLGIEAVLGVADGGGNKAHGNGNPAQCTNVACK